MAKPPEKLKTTPTLHGAMKTIIVEIAEKTGVRLPNISPYHPTVEFFGGDMIIKIRVSGIDPPK